MSSLYAYTDYRAYLRDAYLAAKRANPVCSYRYFARRAGFASPNFLQLVIEGKRNLSQESIHRFAGAFKLRRRERLFFEVLVHFNQAKDPEEQNGYYQRLLEFPEYCQAVTLAQEQYEFLTRWYYPVIQDLTTLPGFREDPEWIAKRLRYEITASQAREALDCLQRLGLLICNDDGHLQPAERHLTTGDVARSAASYHYHQQMMERAKRALQTQTEAQREFGALTIALNTKQLKMLKTAIRDFRKVALNLLSQGDEQPTAVYQLNIQLFGHTDLKEGGRHEK
ncbi:MAG: TIGR02147 family protein [Deltaproteobacteria bacterium]|nr:TIGR02147 family protein [Deltaproteobacteria bacterium]